MFQTLGKLFSPFFGVAFSVACVGGLLSGLVTYEQNSLVKLVGGVDTKMTTQLSIVASIVSITALSGLCIFGTNYLKHKAYISIVQFFFNNICLQKLEHWDTYFSKSEMLKCVHTDISALAEAGTRIFSITTKNVIALGVVSYLLYKEHVLFLSFGASMCIMRSYFLEQIARKWEKQHDVLNDIKRITEEQITEYINNVDHMQLYGLDCAYRTYIHNSLNAYDVEQIKESKILAVFMTSFSAITKTIDIGVFFVVSLVDYMNNAGQTKSTLSSQLERGLHIQLLLAYYKFLTESFQSIADIPKIIKLNKQSYQRIKKYFHHNLPTRSFADFFVNNFTNQSHFDIQFKNVTFKYPSKDVFVLSDFNLTIPFKSKIALKGDSGVGKSTLIKLLLGLYTPQQGHVLIADSDSSVIRNTTDYVSIVPQDPIILGNKTLKENLAIFTQSACDESMLKHALDIVHLTPFQNALDETLVNLSGGQKVRLAIARAILNDAPIIVLDEPFSAMDPCLKASLTKKLIEMWKEKTIILITHDEAPPPEFDVHYM